MVAAVPNNIYVISSFHNVPADTGSVVKNHFWWKNELIIDKLVGYLNAKNIQENVIDIGCNIIPFKKATHVVDFENNTTKIQNIEDKNKFNIDLDLDRLPVVDKFFNFVYCRHTLEDIANPQFALQEMMRVSSRGFIETPSPLIESLRRIDGLNCDGMNPELNYCGYMHHRYIVWSNKMNNTIYFLPKYPIIEYLKHNEVFLNKCVYIANNFPVYWNNYYFWDEHNTPNVVVYRHGVNFNINEDFPKLLYEGVYASIEYTNHFLLRL